MGKLYRPFFKIDYSIQTVWRLDEIEVMLMWDQRASKRWPGLKSQPGYYPNNLSYMHDYRRRKYGKISR